jgi:hypothetical protein
MSDPVQSARAHLLQRGRRFAVPLPDAAMAVVLGLAAMLEFLPVHVLAVLPASLLEAREELLFALMVEGGFLMMQGTLVDIASRLKKRPPVWLIPFIVGGVLLVSNEALGVVQMAWHRGSVVFIPLLLSLAERGTVLWHLPSRSKIEKLAARALIGNRITTGLAMLALMTALLVASLAIPSLDFTALGSRWPPLLAGAIYFAVAAFDDWRVRGKRFAKNPRVLFGFDPIGVRYLEPL